MELLNGKRRKYLRGLAQKLDPLIIIGKGGVSDALIHATKEALADHELIKIRFNEFKTEKKELTALLSQKTESQVAGMIGHVAILYRQQDDEEKRQIYFPE
jgi:RNA-binding protein